MYTKSQNKNNRKVYTKFVNLEWNHLKNHTKAHRKYAKENENNL